MSFRLHADSNQDSLFVNQLIDANALQVERAEVLVSSVVAAGSSIDVVYNFNVEFSAAPNVLVSVEKYAGAQWEFVIASAPIVSGSQVTIRLANSSGSDSVGNAYVALMAWV